MDLSFLDKHLEKKKPLPSTEPATGQLDLSFLNKPTPVQSEPQPVPKLDLSFLGKPAPKEEGTITTSEAFRAGLGEAIDPFGLVLKDTVGINKKEKSGSDIAVQAITNLGANLAMGQVFSAAGGAIGSLLGPAGAVAGAVVGRALGTTQVAKTLGLAAYGVYQGFGREYIRASVEGKPTSLGRSVALSALEANPLFTAGSKVMKILRAAGQVAGEAGVEYSYDKNKTNALVAGALGVIGGAAILRGGLHAPKPSPTIAAKTADSYTDVLSNNSYNLLEKVQDNYNKIKSDIPEVIPLDFKKRYLGMVGDSKQNVEREWARQVEGKLSKSRLQEAWDLDTWDKAQMSEVEKLRSSLSSEIAEHGLKDNTSKLGFAMKDAKFVARDADMVTGLNTEGTLDSLSEARNLHDKVTTAFMNKGIEAARKARALKLSNTDVGYALSNQAEKMSPQGQKIFKDRAKEVDDVLESWRNVFEDARKYMESQGFNIAKREDYIPMYSLKGSDLALALDDAKVKLQDGMVKYQAKDLASLRQAANKAKDTNLVTTIAELDDIYNHRVFNTFAKNKAGMNSIEDVDSMVREAIEGSKSSSGFTLSAMMQRRGEMPELMRNYDVNQLFLEYVNGNMKAVHFNKALKQLEHTSKALEGLGMKETSKYFQKLGMHISGGESGVVADMNRRMTQLAFDAEKALKNNPSAWDAIYYKIAKNLPDIHSWAVSTIYPSFLGLNVRAGLRNLTQPLMVTAPELGQYGYKLLRKAPGAFYDSATNPAKMEDFLRSKNLIADRFHGEDFVKEGMFQSGLPSRLIDAFNQKAMWAYGKTDAHNRYTTWKMAEAWAEDIAKGNQQAIKALKNLSTGAKSQLKVNNINPQDTEAMTDFLGRYLISKTQFNYGKEQLNQFGREYGKMVSMFTKWPAMITSDIVEMYKTKGGIEGSKKFIQKYLAPLGILMSIQQLALDGQQDPSKAKYLVGELTSYSPLSAVGGVAGGQLGSPLVRMGSETISGALEAVQGRADLVGALERGAKGAVKTGLTTFVPILSPVINEIDRYRLKKLGQEKISDVLLEDIGFPGK